MKKRILMVTLFSLACFVTLSFTNNVKAAFFSDLESWGVVTKDGENNYKLKEEHVGLGSEGKGQDIIVKSGENIIFDLNGKKLTNYTAGCEVIKVEQGGSLTIKDSSGKNAEVSLGEGSTYCVISNRGTLTIEGGKYTTNLDNNGVVENFGTLNIKGGEFSLTSTSSNHSTIFNEKDSILNITGGTFTTKSDHSVISNKGNLTMTGGSVSASRTSSTNYLVDNMGILKIGGETSIKNGDSSAAAIGNIPMEANGPVTGTIEISGGKLESKYNLVTTNGGKVIITGGDLKTTEDGYAVVNNGGDLEVSNGNITAEKSSSGAIYVSGEAKVNVTGGTISAPESNYDVYIVNPDKAKVEVAENSGRVAIKNDVKGYAVFKTADGKEINGKYSDIKFIVKINDEEVKDYLELVIGEKSDISAKAYLKGYELVEQIKLTSKDSKIATFEDGKIKGVEKGETTLTLQLGDKTQDIKVTVVEAKAKDNTPKTGMTDYIVYISLVVALVALGGIYTVKKLVK